MLDNYKCISYSGNLSLQNKILSFELLVFFYQSIKLIVVMAYAWAAAMKMVIFSMVETTLAACGSGGSGQITRVLEPVIRREECIYRENIHQSHSSG